MTVRKKFLGQIGFIFLAIIALFLAFYWFRAEATVGERPFGGFSILVIHCDVSRNYLIAHLPAAGPSPIIFQDPGSILYPYSKIKESGNWILGNVSFSVPCVKEIAGTPVSLGSYPVITIVGTSDPSHIARSGRVTDDETEDRDAEPDEEEPVTDEEPEPVLPGSCGETPSENGQTENEVRDRLRSSGVAIAPGLSPTLSPVGKLPNNAIYGAEDLARSCGSGCNVMITSGARQAGNPTAPGSHGTGKPVFDLNKDPGLDSYIVNNSSSNYTDNLGTHYIMPNGDEYLDENYGATGGTGEHWHVRINANHCPLEA